MEKNVNKPTDILKQEHRIIEKALILIDSSVKKIEQDTTIPKNIFIELIDFLKNFADSCHHAKEENILFPFLVNKGLPKDEGPVGVMLSEHTEGRNLIKKFQFYVDELYGGKKEEYNELKAAALSYTDLLRQHIFKEDNILFPIADKMLSKEDTETIMRLFDEAEEKFNKDKNIKCHCYYIELLGKIKKLLYNKS